MIASRQHHVVFLTKRPFRMAEWIMPLGCAAGVTATCNPHAMEAAHALRSMVKQQSIVKLLSVEPIQEAIRAEHLKGIDWVIVGCQTGPGAPGPDWNAVEMTVQAAKDVGCRVFVKENTQLVGPREWPEGWR